MQVWLAVEECCYGAWFSYLCCLYMLFLVSIVPTKLQLWYKHQVLQCNSCTETWLWHVNDKKLIQWRRLRGHLMWEKDARLTNFRIHYLACFYDPCYQSDIGGQWPKVGSCVFCAPLDQCIGRLNDRHSTDELVDILAECRPICWSTYWLNASWYVNRTVSVDISTNISVDTQPICQPTLDRYVGRYVYREWLFDCRPTCRSIGYWHFTDASLTQLLA